MSDGGGGSRGDISSGGGSSNRADGSSADEYKQIDDDVDADEHQTPVSEEGVLTAQQTQEDRLQLLMDDRLQLEAEAEQTEESVTLTSHLLALPPRLLPSLAPLLISYSLSRVCAVIPQ